MGESEANIGVFLIRVRPRSDPGFVHGCRPCIVNEKITHLHRLSFRFFPLICGFDCYAMKYVYAWMFAGMVSLLFACGSPHGQRETFGGGELYYKDGATADDAQKLGNYLLSVGFFDDGSPASAQLVKRGDTYVFRFSANEEAIQDESFARLLRFMSMDISADVFNQAPVDVELTDGNFVARKTVASPGERTRQGKITVYRSNEVDQATADRVTGYIRTAPAIRAEEEHVLSYARRGDDFIFEILLPEDVAKSPDAATAYKLLAGLISVYTLQNKPVTLHFLSDDYSIRRIYPFEEILTTYRETLADSARNNTRF